MEPDTAVGQFAPGLQSGKESKRPTSTSSNANDERILVIAPVEQDAAAMCNLLQDRGFQVSICTNPTNCFEEMAEGAGVLLLTDEVLEMPRAEHLMAALKNQPPWSELPLIVLTKGGESRLMRLLDEAAASAGTITLLERPLGAMTLVRAVEGALNSRRRQYRVRDLIAEQERIHHALRQSEAQFRDMAENIAPLAWMADREGEVFFYNKRWFEYTGASFEEMQGWGWGKAQHPDHTSRVMEKWKSHLKSGTPWEDTFLLRGKDGNYRWFLARAFPLRDGEGKIIRWFGTHTDIQNLRETQDALHAAQEKLLQHSANLEKTVEERTTKLRETVHELEAFSYSVAHDLRAPLRAMNSYAQLVRDLYAGCMDDQGRDFLQRISSSAERLDTLIQDVLNYTRVIRTPAHSRPVDLDKLVRDIIHTYPNFQPPGAEIQVDGILPQVMGHEGFLTQCVSNLLGNAVKFVKPGEKPKIRIFAQLKRDDVVRVWFEDNGIGIPPKNHERIFRMFERLHPAEEYEGMGIGLTIVKKAVERMGGRVGFESEVGKGSEFWIELRKARD